MDTKTYIKDDLMHYFIIAQVLCEMGVNLPQRKFFQELTSNWLAVRGRFNFMNVSRYFSCHERTLRRWFGRDFAWPEFQQRLLEHIIAPDHELIAALDASYVPKSGRRTPGLDYYFSGCAGRALKGLEVGLLCVVDVTRNTAYALNARQTMPCSGDGNENQKPTGRKTKRAKAAAKTKTNQTRIDAYLQHVEALRALLPARVRHLAVDGYYTCRKFVDGVCNLELEVVGKLRRDANLKYLYHGPQKKRGRPRQYAGKVEWTKPDMRRWKDEGEVEPGVRLLSAVLYHVSLKRPIKVAMLHEANTGKPRRVLLYSTDSKLSGRDIVRYYRARFQIEFLFRDAKGATGLNDCQSRHAKAIDFHWNAAFCSLNLAKWEEEKRAKTTAFSASSCKQRYSNQNLLRVFSDMLGFNWSSIKSHPDFEALCNYGAISP